MTLPFKSPPPFITSDCRLPAQICDQSGQPLTDDAGTPWLADLDGGAGMIEWAPQLRVMSNWGKPLVERGLDDYRLRVWKRRHGVLWVGYDSANPDDPYTEPAFTDPWATWLGEHMDLRFRLADIEFQIVQTESYRNGINFWMNGRRVSA